jgi:hypothetical protein
MKNIYTRVCVFILYMLYKNTLLVYNVIRFVILLINRSIYKYSIS